MNNLSLDSLQDAVRLIEEYGAFVLQRADANGVCRGTHAVRAAELAHEIHRVLDYEAEHFRLLSLEHREGEAQR